MTARSEASSSRRGSEYHLSPDDGVLDLPLLDDHHRTTAHAIQEWVFDNSDLWEDPEDRRSPVTTGKEIRRALGAARWFEFLHPGSEGDRTRGDARSLCLIRRHLAYAEDLADFSFSIQALAAAPLVRYGTVEQRNRWLPGMSRGDSSGTLALSEPSAGSDLSAVELRATPVDGGYALTGRKAWIAGGDSADVHSVLARTGEGPGPLGLSLLLVPSDTPGLTVEPVGSIAPRSFSHLRFDGCFVPARNVIGRPGQGYSIAMEILERFRMTVGAAALGFGRRAANAAAARARGRNLGSGYLADLGTVRSVLAEMEVKLNAASLLVTRAAWDLDHERRGFAESSSIAKLYATESAQEVADATVQIFGAAGVEAGSLPERLYRQVRSLRIYEGTSEIQRSIIADSALGRAARRER
ncbi:acyl-CoA dehydrogenase family protein [Halostreptopolyspora alba]|uniref:Medium-chain specific acyl-CoA dehydrogenase, mitochondrial n=1 Tax=Halostreptopolyspora alba TaxID=2487137 RepID=A0A3N0EI03_9ACTN|nr:acyl-CoA dehydrogenase [Nocardiopsaceae bacterium YIM 96095]